MQNNPRLTFFWFRRDLRLDDNAGLYHALRSPYPVIPVFIFDTNILNKLDNRQDARVSFIYDTVQRLRQQLEARGSALLIKYGDPVEVWQELASTYQIQAVFTNRDYENYALQRDTTVKQLLENKGIAFQTYKDHVIFEGKEVVKNNGEPYSIFTPYANQWRKKLQSRTTDSNELFYLKLYPTKKYFNNFCKIDTTEVPSLAQMGFERSDIQISEAAIDETIVEHYDQTRETPANTHGTTRLGIHLRFGTVSVRQCAQVATRLNPTFLNELIWRDFYAMILANFPRVETQAFRPAYDAIKWRNDEAEFQKWCDGKTGYPLVDAGMRQLNATGFMHNRVRMVVASFLTKHLLIDWRWGEAYFAKKLLDFDLASNNGGWQWASGSGTDAAPYFRVFNPLAQQEKFDKDGRYIKKWLPEYATTRYPKPIVEHTAARNRCLETYKSTLQGLQNLFETPTE